MSEPRVINLSLRKIRTNYRLLTAGLLATGVFAASCSSSPKAAAPKATVSLSPFQQKLAAQSKALESRTEDRSPALRGSNDYADGDVSIEFDVVDGPNPGEDMALIAELDVTDGVSRTKPGVKKISFDVDDLVINDGVFTDTPVEPVPVTSKKTTKAKPSGPTKTSDRSTRSTDTPSAAPTTAPTPSRSGVVPPPASQTTTTPAGPWKPNKTVSYTITNFGVYQHVDGGLDNKLAGKDGLGITKGTNKEYQTEVVDTSNPDASIHATATVRFNDGRTASVKTDSFSIRELVNDIGR